MDSDELHAPWSNAAHWIPLNKKLEQCWLSESFRLGPTGVHLLQRMFPRRHDHMESARGELRGPEDSLVLLTPLRRLDDWHHYNTTPEIMWSASFVKHCASILAVELVALLHKDAVVDFKGGIHIVSFLKGFLAELQAFLEIHLADLCSAVHRHFRLKQPQGGLERYTYASVRHAKALSISTALAAGGGDGPVEILCLPHRQAGDWGWAGDATQRHLLFIAASRYSKRLHVVVEDLRDEIVVPDHDSEAVSLGLKQTSNHLDHRQHSPAEIRCWEDEGRKQLSLVRMIKFGEEEWGRLQVPTAFCRNVGDDGVAPAFHSPVFWQHLRPGRALQHRCASGARKHLRTSGAQQHLRARGAL